MPIVQPDSFRALGLVPFQINPHYPAAAHASLRETRDERLSEFLAENDVPVLALCEGSWLRVRGATAEIGGTAGGRLFTRNSLPRTVEHGEDISSLLASRPQYDTSH